jgi:hypothetical protein
VHLARAAGVEDGLGAGLGVEAAARAVEDRVLHPGVEAGEHGHRLEGRAGDVVRAERTVDERLVAVVGVEPNPRLGVFLNFLEAVGRVRVHGEHLARLRVEGDDRAVPPLELRDGLLLQLAVDGQPHVEVAGLLDLALHDDVDGLGHGARLDAEEGAFEAGVAAVGAEELRHLGVERVLADDAAVRPAAVERERAFEAPRAVENPAAQGRFGEPAVAQVFVAELLEALVRVRGVLRPVDVEAEDGEREEDEDPSERLEPAVGRGRAETRAHLGREVGRRDRVERRTPPPAPEHQRDDQQQRQQRQPAHVDEAQQRRLFFGNVCEKKHKNKLSAVSHQLSGKTSPLNLERVSVSRHSAERSSRLINN